MLIFLGKQFCDHFIRDGPADYIGGATGSDWINEESFVDFIKYFIHHTKPSAVDSVVFFLNNHSSHLRSQALDL
jgi:hypothetical protein